MDNGGGGNEPQQESQGFFDRVDAWFDRQERTFFEWLDRVTGNQPIPGTGDVGSPTGGSGGEVLTDRNEEMGGDR